ncbi:hypothetical protein OROHE_009102 [Orobanche hederae]
MVVEYMGKVARFVAYTGELTMEERKLLNVAYWNLIGARRVSWNIIASNGLKEESNGNEVGVLLIKDFRQKIESEISNLCDSILNLLDSHLLPSASSPESKDIALANLVHAHPTRLALNFSVFYYEILNNHEYAFNIAKEAFDDAISKLDMLSEQSYKESTLLLQKLKSNMSLKTETRVPRVVEKTCSFVLLTRSFLVALISLVNPRLLINDYKWSLAAILTWGLNKED